MAVVPAILLSHFAVSVVSTCTSRLVTGSCEWQGLSFLLSLMCFDHLNKIMSGSSYQLQTQVAIGCINPLPIHP